MKNAVVYSNDDIRELLAKTHDVPVKNVIKNQYSYTVILSKEETAEQSE